MQIGQHAAEVVLDRLHRINDQPIRGQRGYLGADPLDMIPPDLMPAGNSANSLPSDTPRR